MYVLNEELRAGVRAKVASGEPVFVLRASDEVAVEVVREWCILARLAECPGEKVRAVAAIADEMEQWQDRKVPD